jgi:hypothetical protein
MSFDYARMRFVPQTLSTQTSYLVGDHGISIPLLKPLAVKWPYQRVRNFDSYCGAGKGIGDKIVPESILGVKVSPACFVHDKMWELASASWADFHYSNSIFLHNLISLIELQSRSAMMKHLRLYRAVTYYNAVDSVGARIFKKQKGM